MLTDRRKHPLQTTTEFSSHNLPLPGPLLDHLDYNTHLLTKVKHQANSRAPWRGCKVQQPIKVLTTSGTPASATTEEHPPGPRALIPLLTVVMQVSVAAATPREDQRPTDAISLPSAKPTDRFLQPLVSIQFPHGKLPERSTRLGTCLRTRTRSSRRLITGSTVSHFIDKGENHVDKWFGLLTMDCMPASGKTLEAAIRE